MANICAINIPAGINGDCLKFEKPVKSFIITSPSESFASLSALQNLATWKTKVKTLLAWLPYSLASYENTTDDPTINSTAFGNKVFVRPGVPSMTAMLYSNPCDFSNLLNTLEGGSYGVFLVLEDDTIVAYRKSDGTFTGFTAQIDAATKGIPLPDAIENSYPVWFGFTNYSQFKSRAFVSVPWNVANELIAASPVGLNLINTESYGGTTAGDIDVLISERCGDAVEDLVLADFEVVDSNNLDTPAVTAAVDNDNGSYTLTIEKGSTPAALAAGDYVIIRVKVLDGTDVTHVSGNLYIQA